MTEKTLTINEVRKLIVGGPSKDLLIRLRADPRKGVQKLLASYGRRCEREVIERARIDELCHMEQDARSMGYLFVGGIDEAGRGPLAGPVVAACVILPESIDSLSGLNDSKLLTAETRDRLYDKIRKIAVGFGIGVVKHKIIDDINILQATRLAMLQAWETCDPRPDYLLIDGSGVPDLPVPQRPFPKADQRSACVAAASVLAKVHRDRIMLLYDEEFPDYGFARHKGYGTAEHVAALARVGICPIHRKSFAPVSRYVLPTLDVLRRYINRSRNTAALAMVGEQIRDAYSFLTAEEIIQLREEYRAKKLVLGREHWQEFQR